MAEIAAALDCSAKAVENRLYHARQQLKQALQPIGEVSR
jgi:DNA-directed RNA polymerase specialized sigma24 family protein